MTSDIDPIEQRLSRALAVSPGPEAAARLHGRVVASMAARAGRTAATPRHRPWRPLLAPALAIVVLVGVAAAMLSLNERRDTSGIAAVPSSGTAPVGSVGDATRSSQPSPATAQVRATWTVATHPDSPHRQNMGRIWSDGIVTLAGAQEGRQQVIWASTDGGSTWRRAEMLDKQGQPYQKGLGVGFAFTKSDGSYYALTPYDLQFGKPGTNIAVLRSTDGFNWQMIARHMPMPDGADMAGDLAPTGFTGPGSIATPNKDGFEQRVVAGRNVRVWRTPVVLTSTDGVTWTDSVRLPVDPAEQGPATSFLVGPDGTTLVTGGLRGLPSPDGYRKAMWRSDDGVTFERVTYGPVAMANSAPDGHVITLAPGVYDGGFFVEAIDIDDPGTPTTLWTSPDGKDWTAHQAPAGIGLEGAVAVDGGILELAVTPSDPAMAPGDIAGRLLTATGEWLDVPGQPFPLNHRAVATGPGTIAVDVDTDTPGTPLVITGAIDVVVAP